MKMRFALAACVAALSQAHANAQSTFTLDFDDPAIIPSVTVLDDFYLGSAKATLENFRFIDPNDPSLSDPYTPVVAVAGEGVGGTNALDASLVGVYVNLDPFVFPMGADTFSFTPDSNPFGDALAQVEFFGRNGDLLGTLPFDQTLTTGGVLSSPFSGVQRVLLPGGAFYDNITFAGTAVPEPGTLAFVLTSAFCGGTLAYRRRQK